MMLNVRVSGSVWSSLIFDNVRQQGDKEGFLIGEISMQELTNISDSQINKTTRQTTVNVISHTICPKPFSFYNRLGQIDNTKLEGLLKNNYDSVVGWFRCRSGSIPEPSLREITIHHHLRELLGAHNQTFLFGIFGEGSNINHTTITYYYNFYTFNNELFTPQKISIENLGDTAQSEYKHGSSLNTESSGSDSYRDILTSYKKEMIDKDGYLQGMRGIKKTDEAIHNKMKVLKDCVVESEKSVKGLVTEIKMLNQQICQINKPVQMETVSFPEESPEQPEENHKIEKHERTSENEFIEASSTQEESQEADAEIADPFTSLIVDMKASITTPGKPQSNSGAKGNNLLQPECRKVRSNSGSPVPNSLQRNEITEGLSSDRTKSGDESESDSTQLPDSPSVLEASGSQTF